MVELAQPAEAELDDPLRGELAAGPAQLRAHAVDERVEIVAAHRALVGGPGERGAELRAVEALALPVALADPELLGATRS